MATTSPVSIRSLTPAANPAQIALQPTPQKIGPVDTYSGPSAAQPITVGQTTFRPCTLGDLRPGDIGFQYQPRGRNFRQFWITVGGHLARLGCPQYDTDPYVVHAFVVVQPNPAQDQLNTMDGAGGNYRDFNAVCMDFATGAHVVPRAQYFFYRCTDEAMRQRIVSVAKNWASPGAHNFSLPRAVASPFHPIRFCKHAIMRAFSLSQQGDIPAPPVHLPSQRYYRMHCSDFVTNVCITATLNVWRDGGHPIQSTDDVVRGLSEGPTGGTFAIDSRGASPMYLQARLQDSPYFEPIGYIPDRRA